MEPNLTECLFCRIIRRELPADIIADDASVLAIRDINPKAPVHILILPKVHIASIAHLDSGHADMIAKIVYAAKHIAEEQGLKGYKIGFNVGREGGQMIDHLHLHLLAGWVESSARERPFGA